ncbi:MAG: hypothetical protein FJ083_14160 [Cyanobacteria bacterium K_Offshore_surface_m2_239]|nr:hypothetical protein [Cyanobacteria bacterium K_Offshore_surface_m2_239]
MERRRQFANGRPIFLSHPAWPKDSNRQAWRDQYALRERYRKTTPVLHLQEMLCAHALPTTTTTTTEEND